MTLPSPHLTEIPDEGMSLTCAVQPDELDLGLKDAQVRGEFSLSVQIAKVGRCLHVVGVLEGTFVRHCVRCLKEYDDPASLSFAVEYRRDERASRQARSSDKHVREAPEQAEQEAAEDDDDVYFMVGEQLELAEMLREQVILAEPMQPLCHDDCPGLCPVCGQDLNDRRCGCPEERRKSPFEVLQSRIERRSRSL